MKKEEWRPIKDYEGLYEISNLGRVKSLPRKSGLKNQVCDIILKANLSTTGYPQVILCKNGSIKSVRIHRLVAETFIPNPHKYPVVNHLDENRQNNSVDNLEWCTQRHNLYHSRVPQKRKAAAVKSWEKPVAMFTKEWVFIRNFESVTKAAKYIGDFQQNVSKCCYDGKYTCKGFRFKFI